jgi:ribosomal protein S12 methylthiotransferase accessory factor
MWYPFRPGERRFAAADSIGCGAGRTFADAALSGLCEWIERDAMAIWWYNMARRPGVRLHSFESPQLLGISEALRRGGRNLHLLDVTVESGIPAYVAVAPDFDGNEPIIAAAAALSPRLAALRAASEASQLIFQAFYAKALESEYHAWLKNSSLRTQDWLEPNEWVDAPSEPDLMSVQDQLDFCARRLAECDIRTFAVDQTSPDVLVRTVRIIAPGLRHIWARFAPGRLYETPVQLGWRDTAVRESNLNSILCMI